MQIKFWGTRGSLPKAESHLQVKQSLLNLLDLAKNEGIQQLSELRDRIEVDGLSLPLSYGGHTSCTQFVDGDTSIYVDMGSGLKEAGTEAIKQGRREFAIFQTHMHWDHIIGLPFFVPIYTQGHSIKIYHVHKNAPEYVRIKFNGVNFPVKWEQLQGQIEFIPMKLYETARFGNFEVTPFALDHPGGCFGYEVESQGKRVSIGVDGEYKRRTREELGKDLPYFQNLDLLVFDAQYEMDELSARFDWGHSSPNIGVELALREGIKSLALTHHDPWSDKPKLERMLSEAKRHMKKILPNYAETWKGQATGPNIFTAYDGLSLEL